ncbi:MAG: hypothetical protein GY803_26180 [Chloroflexi bacterium]|nr:hypothetical protein [Chloroflexota bacterium]
MGIIWVNGAVQRSFHFPADPATALAFYNDLGRITQFLPHISLQKTYGRNRARALYHTRELGAFQVRIFCDLQSEADATDRILTVRPIKTAPAVPADRGFYHTSAQGQFASESRFYPNGDQTRIVYRLQLGAELPPPFGLQLLPGDLLNRIAASITNGRIDEIVSGFIERSIAAFPAWQASKATD